eukprot:5006986-Pyramimonas_sp.AAC.1
MSLFVMVVLILTKRRATIHDGDDDHDAGSDSDGVEDCGGDSQSDDEDVGDDDDEEEDDDRDGDGGDGDEDDDELLTLRASPPGPPETMPRRVALLRRAGEHAMNQELGKPSNRSLGSSCADLGTNRMHLRGPVE